MPSSVRAVSTRRCLRQWINSRARGRSNCAHVKTGKSGSSGRPVTGGVNAVCATPETERYSKRSISEQVNSEAGSVLPVDRRCVTSGNYVLSGDSNITLYPDITPGLGRQPAATGRVSGPAGHAGNLLTSAERTGISRQLDYKERDEFSANRECHPLLRGSRDPCEDYQVDRPCEDFSVPLVSDWGYLSDRMAYLESQEQPGLPSTWLQYHLGDQQAYNKTPADRLHRKADMMASRAAMNWTNAGQMNGAHYKPRSFSATAYRPGMFRSSSNLDVRKGKQSNKQHGGKAHERSTTVPIGDILGHSKALSERPASSYGGEQYVYRKNQLRTLVNPRSMLPVVEPGAALLNHGEGFQGRSAAEGLHGRSASRHRPLGASRFRNIEDLTGNVPGRPSRAPGMSTTVGHLMQDRMNSSSCIKLGVTQDTVVKDVDDSSDDSGISSSTLVTGDSEQCLSPEDQPDPGEYHQLGTALLCEKVVPHDKQPHGDVCYTETLNGFLDDPSSRADVSPDSGVDAGEGGDTVTLDTDAECDLNPARQVHFGAVSLSWSGYFAIDVKTSKHDTHKSPDIDESEDSPADNELPQKTNLKSGRTPSRDKRVRFSTVDEIHEFEPFDAIR